MRTRRIAALLAIAACGWAASAADALLAQVVESIPREERGPGSPARARAIAGLLGREGLDAAIAAGLRTALAEAWIEAGDAVAAQAAAALVLGDRQAAAELRERAGLAWVAAWGERGEGGAEDPEAAIAAFPSPAVRVRAAAALARGRRLLAAGEAQPALAAFDRALAHLAEAGSEERVPVYVLRLLAMEAGGAEPAAVQAWLHGRAADPAAALAAEAVPAAGQGLVGQPAPALSGRRLDGGEGGVDLAALRGRPVIIDFFATWCRPCAGLAPALAAAVRGYGDRVRVVGVSLDTPDTVAAIPAFRAAHGITWPLVGDGLGWDSETDDAYQVGAIPALVLLDAQGRVAAVDLVGGTPAATIANLDRALAALAALAAPPPAAKAPPVKRELLP